MNATTVDLRYKTRDILRSIDRGETVVITFRGKPRGIITPPQFAASTPESGTEVLRVTDHPFFGSARTSSESVDAVMDRLRGGRFRDL